MTSQNEKKNCCCVQGPCGCGCHFDMKEIEEIEDKIDKIIESYRKSVKDAYLLGFSDGEKKKHEKLTFDEHD